MKEKELFFKAQCYVSNNTPDLYAYKHYDYDVKTTFYRLADAVGEIVGDFITVKELVDFVQQDNLPDHVNIHDLNKTGRLSDYEILYDFVHG
jgi:hypothetical protein